MVHCTVNSKHVKNIMMLYPPRAFSTANFPKWFVQNRKCFWWVFTSLLYILSKITFLKHFLCNQLCMLAIIQNLLSIFFIFMRKIVNVNCGYKETFSLQSYSTHLLVRMILRNANDRDEWQKIRNAAYLAQKWSGYQGYG